MDKPQKNKIWIVLVLSCLLGVLNLGLKVYELYRPAPPISLTMEEFPVEGEYAMRLANWRPSDGFFTVEEYSRSRGIEVGDILEAIDSRKLQAYPFKFRGTGWMIPKDAEISENPKKIELPPNP